MESTLSAWETFKDIRTRNLFKNKYLSGRGLMKPQINEIMRKMKVYINRIEQSTLGMRVKKAENIQSLATIFNEIFNNEWKEYIKDNYKDVPAYFQDYCNFIMLMQKYIKTYYVNTAEANNLKYPNGELIKLDDFVKSSRIRHNHIKLFIQGGTYVYSATKALTAVISYIGIDAVYAANYKIIGMKVLTKHVSLGLEKKYTNIGGGWFLCTLGDTMSKVRLIRILAMHFNKEIKAEMV
jgi:hypothetical protein